MQSQGQQMGMGIQQGYQMPSPDMTPQPASPETQLNMQPAQNENQPNPAIIQNPDAMQAPSMMQNGNMNMAQAQIYENPSTEKPQAAPAPPPPPNDPPFGSYPGDNSSLNIDPVANESLNNLEKNKADYASKVKNYLDDLSPGEFKIFEEEMNKKKNMSNPADMQSKVM